MIRPLTALILFGYAAPSFAESQNPLPVTVVECGTAGCNCRESAIPVTEFEVLLGAEVPVGAERPIVVDLGDGYVWSALTVDELEVMAGGDGTCSTDAALVPEDGLWSSNARFVSLDCGSITSMMRSMMEPSLNSAAPARVVWNGHFGGETYQRAWAMANPDAENVIPSFVETSATTSEGSMTITGESGTILNNYRFELLSTKLFQGDFYMTSQMTGQFCDWHIRSLVRKVSD